VAGRSLCCGTTEKIYRENLAGRNDARKVREVTGRQPTGELPEGTRRTGARVGVSSQLIGDGGGDAAA